MKTALGGLKRVQLRAYSNTVEPNKNNCMTKISKEISIAEVSRDRNQKIKKLKVISVSHMAKATTFPMACSVENPNRLCHWGAQQPPWQYGLLHCVCAYESQWPAPQRIQADFTTEVSNNHCHNGPLREEILQPPKKESGVLGPRMPPLPPRPILTPDPRATAVTHVPKLQTLTVHVLFVCLFCVYPHLGHWSQHHWGLGSAPDSGVTVSTNAPTLSSSQLLGCSACTNISDTRATTTVGSQCPNPWSRCCSVDIHSRAQLHSCSMVPMHQTPMPTLPRRLSWTGHGSKRDTLCHDNPSRRRKIRSSLEDFTTKDPIRPHHCFRQSRPWPMKTPAIFVNSDLSWWSCREQQHQDLPGARTTTPHSATALVPHADDLFPPKPVHKFWKRLLFHQMRRHQHKPTIKVKNQGSMTQPKKHNNFPVIDSKEIKTMNWQRIQDNWFKED